MGRRKMAERVRRMIGQGLNPYGKSKAWWKESVKGKSTKIRCATCPALASRDSVHATLWLTAADMYAISADLY